MKKKIRTIYTFSYIILMWRQARIGQQFHDEYWKNDDKQPYWNRITLLPIKIWSEHTLEHAFSPTHTLSLLPDFGSNRRLFCTNIFRMSVIQCVFGLWLFFLNSTLRPFLTRFLPLILTLQKRRKKATYITYYFRGLRPKVYKEVS